MPANAPPRSSIASRGSARRGSARLVVGATLTRPKGGRSPVSDKPAPRQAGRDKPVPYGVVPASHRPQRHRVRATLVVDRVDTAGRPTSGTGQARPRRRRSLTPSAAETPRGGDPCGRRVDMPAARQAGRDKPVPYGVVPRTHRPHEHAVGATLVVARVGHAGCPEAGRDNAARRLAPSGPSPHRPRTPRLAAAPRAALRRRLLGPSPTVLRRREARVPRSRRSCRESG